MSGDIRQDLIDAFHQIYYSEHKQTLELRWAGVQVVKCPLDLWVYQEIMYETQPDLIVETGTFHGGSAAFLSAMCVLFGHGEVISIDILDRLKPVLPRVDYLIGSSVDPEISAMVRMRARGKRVMVILDSDHSPEHVAAELLTYGDLVTPGCYLIVEDTNTGGHPVQVEPPGPMPAVASFLSEGGAGFGKYEVDVLREKFLLTFNPSGYLRRLP